ncbi:MAG: RNA polymerase sigma factor [Planctomycetota bacterium]
MVTPPSDEILMQRVRQGDARAFDALVLRHQGRVANLFHKWGGQYYEIEDLMQETFLRLLHAAPRYKPTARFTTFLHILARHSFLDHLRTKRRKPLAPLAEGTDIEAPADTSDTRLDIAACLDRLPWHCRETLVLRVYSGLDYAEIAEVLDIPLGTVKSRLHEAMTLLREIARDLDMAP